MSILKHLKNILLLRQVAKAYKEEKGKDKPFYLSRRLWGAVVTLGSALLLSYQGVEIKADILKQLTETIPVFITSATGLYGIIMEIVGIVKREKKQ